jgi:hypothetical protein
MDNTKLRYPIGEFEKPEKITPNIIEEWIDVIKQFPQKLMKEVGSLTENELKYCYRKNGWNIRQIVHHCADSHLNSLIRFKLTLTEELPTIKPYFEDRWAEMPDVNNSPIEHSLNIIGGLHSRWVILLKNLCENELSREFFHPESNRKISLRENIGIYAWHCEHHLEHVRLAKKFKDKFNN